MRIWDYETEIDEDGLHVIYGYWNDEGWWPVSDWLVGPA
jgi:hypothetical protein